MKKVAHEKDGQGRRKLGGECSDRTDRGEGPHLTLFHGAGKVSGFKSYS